MGTIDSNTGRATVITRSKDGTSVTIDNIDFRRAHVTIAGAEQASSVNVGLSGVYRGAWLTTRTFSVVQWEMTSMAILLSPDEMEALAKTLRKAAKEARTLVSPSGAVFEVSDGDNALIS